MVICLVNPKVSGLRQETTWSERLDTLKDILPVFFIFFIVIGSIYAGFATPTESAALGVIAALVIAAGYRRVSLVMLREVVEGTMRTTAMIMLILLAAYFLNFILASVGLTNLLTDFINHLGMSPMSTMAVIVLMYVVLGFFVETLSLMVITIPIVAPVVTGLGFDPIWFGVLLILLVEMALITPPVGLNLYVVQGIRQRGSISDVMIGSVPFVGMILLMIVLMLVFPDMALVLAKYVN